MNDMEKMTIKSQQAMQAAAQLAESKGNPSVDPIHLIYALLTQRDGIVPRVFTKAGAKVPNMISQAEEIIAKKPTSQGEGVKVYAAKDLVDLFNQAEKDAKQMGDSYISTEHFVLAAYRTAPGEVIKLFKDQDVNLEKFLTVLSDVRGAQKVVDDSPESKYEVLSKYARISRHWLKRANSILWSGETKKFVESYKCFHAELKIIPF
ncbi:MAG: Clp protease N-terminal domain-containing protein [Bdellovibrionales bacterium]